MKIFLLAQGPQSRWKQDDNIHGPNKHLLNVLNEPLLGRTVRMLRELGQRDITIIGPREYELVCNAPTITLADPGPLLSGILQVYDQTCFSRVVYLLGDVMFSYAALRTILDCASDLMFFGRLKPSTVSTKVAQELFGFSCNKIAWPTVQQHCEWMTARGRKLNYPPKLWALYRLCSGFEHHEYKTNPSTIVEIDDYTDDIDSGIEYDLFFMPMLYAANLDRL